VSARAEYRFVVCDVERADLLCPRFNIFKLCSGELGIARPGRPQKLDLVGESVVQRAAERCKQHTGSDPTVANRDTGEQRSTEAVTDE